MEPWEAKLREGNTETAWRLFVERYERLILATIRHYVDDRDDVTDVFAQVCASLSADQLARLRRYSDAPSHRARFATWLIAVVRNHTIDWLRHNVGRRTRHLDATLSPLQRRIFECVFVNGLSHVEAYETIRTASDPTLSFGAFLREVANTYRALGHGHRAHGLRELAGAVPLPGDGDPPEDAATTADARARLSEAMETLAPDQRLAVQLFVVHEMPAADVARTVGWPNPKAVYNRVYRALAALRASLERQGIRRGDL
ncbi:MAG: RNA polymerase sigma factor [Gemmatimonadaceae bacterium]